MSTRTLMSTDDPQLASTQEHLNGPCNGDTASGDDIKLTPKKSQTLTKRQAKPATPSATSSFTPTAAARVPKHRAPRKTTKNDIADLTKLLADMEASNAKSAKIVKSTASRAAKPAGRKAIASPTPAGASAHDTA